MSVEAMEKAEKAQGDAKRTASFLVAYWETLADSGMDDHTCKQLTILYGRRLLGQAREKG